MALRKEKPATPSASQLARREAGRWLKSLREAAGLTQADLAERLGLRYYTFVSQVEGGHGRVPSDQFGAWADALVIDGGLFARTLLHYYEPEIWRLIFPDGADGLAPLPPASASASASTPPEADGAEALLG